MPNYLKRGAVDLLAASGGGGGVTELFVPAQMFGPRDGTPTMAYGPGQVGMLGWTLDPTTYEGVMATVALPDGWAGSVVTSRFLFNASASGNIRLGFLSITEKNHLGADLGGGSLAGSQTLAVSTAGAYASGANLTPQATTKLLSISVPRAAADANDTLATDAFFHGVLLTKL